MTEDRKRLLLLQITDSVFPIGAYSHSYGLETYVQNGLVKDESQSADFISKYIRYSLTYSELAAIRFSYEWLNRDDFSRIFDMEEMMNAARTALELRSASQKLAVRFIKTAGSFLDGETVAAAAWQTYVAGRPGLRHQYAAACGVFCALAGIEIADIMIKFAYGQVSAMAVNCVKMIPLSQSAGQNILFALQDEIAAAVNTAKSFDERLFLQAAPGFELRGMQHEGLYSRIYMS